MGAVGAEVKEGKEVLVADDAPFNVLILKEFLESKGVNGVETVNDGGSALEKI